MNFRFATYILIILIFGCWITSCEVSDNGDLDGYWYMTRLDSVESGKTVDMHNRQLTWSFQVNLMQTFDGSHDHWDSIMMFRFDHTGNQLIISDPFIYNRLEGDEFLDSTQYWKLKHYGINDIPTCFKVEKLNRKKMRLSDHVVRLYFEKR